MAVLVVLLGLGNTALRCLHSSLCKKTPLVWQKAWPLRQRARGSGCAATSLSLTLSMSSALKICGGGNSTAEAQTPHRGAHQRELERVATLVNNYLGQRACALLQCRVEACICVATRTMSAGTSSSSCTVCGSDTARK